MKLLLFSNNKTPACTKTYIARMQLTFFNSQSPEIAYTASFAAQKISSKGNLIKSAVRAQSAVKRAPIARFFCVCLGSNLKTSLVMQHAILIPTDFSENAWTAARYGAQLAQHYNWSVHLLHVHKNFGKLLASTEFNEDLDTQQSANAESELEKHTQKLTGEFPGLPITSAIIQGGLTDTIVDLVQDSPIQFIVMGTKGSNGLAGRLIGSNTFEMIQKSPIGVIAVPAGHQEFQLQHIGLLTNFKEEEIHLLDTFISRTNTALDVSLLHVWEGGKHPSEADIDFWKSKLTQATGADSIHFHETEMVKRLDVNNPIPECIEELSQSAAVDLLLISYARRSFFRALFSKSLVKTLAHALSVPAYFLRSSQ